MLTFLIDKIRCTQIYFINLAQNKLTESQRRKLKLLQIIRLSDLFFGFSNAFEYGEKYMIAITFATLVTDMQWDITDAVKTVAKVDIAKRKFNYNEHFRNELKLYSLLILSVILMSLITYPFYKPDLKIASIFISLHILDFMLGPFIEIKICFLQLEDSAFKMTLNMIIAYIIRTSISFVPTPFCTAKIRN